MNDYPKFEDLKGKGCLALLCHNYERGNIDE